jgi:hypothetical protein
LAKWPRLKAARRLWVNQHRSTERHFVDDRAVWIVRLCAVAPSEIEMVPWQVRR